MNYYCVAGEHEKCPDRAHDEYNCSCGCHLYTSLDKYKADQKYLAESHDKE